jgi:hypothetical protein
MGILSVRVEAAIPPETLDYTTLYHRIQESSEQNLIAAIWDSERAKNKRRLTEVWYMYHVSCTHTEFI